MNKIQWPNNHKFAFTIFDDTDFSTLTNTEPIYSYLDNIGIKCTKSIWSLDSSGKAKIGGDSIENKKYLEWILKLKNQGFEISLHNVKNTSSYRFETIKGINNFKEKIGNYPKSFANHADCKDGIYWGDARFSSFYRYLYSIIKYSNVNKFQGHIKNSKYFWGDICKDKIKYVRNFVFNDINTLKQCPFMPYYDPLRPYVNYFFCSSNGADVKRFNQLLSLRNQQKLEEEGGACIVYTHFGHEFYKNGVINEETQKLLKILSKKNGWFCTVSDLLDHIQIENKVKHTISKEERTYLERKWFFEKLFLGTN